MKRFFPFLVAALIVFSLAGCGGNDGVGASNKATSVGKQALTAVDEYLDGESDYSDVEKRLDDCYDALEYTEDEPSGEKDADWYIRVDISSIKTRLILDGYDGDAEDYDKLIEARNSLAKDLGEKNR